MAWWCKITMLSDEEKKAIEILKEKFEGSNKYMLTLSYEDIKELFAIIEVLKNKKPTFLIKDLYNPKLKEVKLQDVEGLIEQGKEEVRDKIKAKIEELDYNDMGNFERRCKQEVLRTLLEKE